MSTSVRRVSVDASRAGGRRQSVMDIGRGSNIARASMDGTRAAMILTSAHSRLPHGPRMENTYRMEPKDTFPSFSAKRIIKDVLEEMIGEKEYDPVESTVLSGKLADVIKQRVKELGHTRYKIVCIVAIGPNNMSSVAFTSRSVWNPKVDTYAEYTHKNNNNMYAIGLVYGIYVE